MNILIICTFYPPDTAISAVRPYMLAKYLSQHGHQVTVVRSGIINKTADNFYPTLENVRVISYLGDDSPAERFERGECICDTTGEGKSRVAFLPPPARKVVSSVYHWADAPRQYYKRKWLVAQRLDLQKRVIGSLKNEHFDVVFSTYSELENAFAGEYAKKVFGCKWIMDFRDPIAQGNGQPKWEYWLSKKLQNSIIRSTDACTAVSDSLLMEKGKRDPKIRTLYNGYEDVRAEEENISPDPGVLSLCYTGQIYGARVAAATVLIKAIASLAHNGTVDINKIRFHYAGNGIDEFREILRQYEAESILVDHGYLSKSGITRLQLRCDLFVVLSWNTKIEQGVLTGKFFEGICAKKPILSLVAGNVPNSELYQINQKYNYGFCYELCQEKSCFDALCDYIQKAYEQKLSSELVPYAPKKELFSAFQYDHLTSILERLCDELLQNE